MPRTACRNKGLAGSRSILRLRRLICTSTARSLAVPSPPVETLEQIAFGPYVYHLERGELRQSEEVIRLTDRERDMLRILALARGETVPRNSLTGDGTVNERAVDVQINRLRRKIERDPANPLFLQAVRGIGYRLVASP